MKQINKILYNFTFLLASFMLIVFAGCQKKQIQAADEKIIIRRGEGGWPSTLDPHFMVGTWESTIARDLFLGLLTDAADDSPIAGCAQSWEMNRNNTVYTFHLRKDILWSDGEPLTAHDFVFSYKRILDVSSGSQRGNELYNIKNAKAFASGTLEDKTQLGVKALDDYTLQIILEFPNPHLEEQLRRVIYYPLPRHQIIKYGSNWSKPQNFISNGAFKLAEWKEKEYVRLEKNPLFYDAEGVSVDEVIYYPLEDSFKALEKFRAGELDMNSDFPPEKFQWLRKHMVQEIKISSFYGLYSYVMNQHLEKFRDRRVREALNLAIDRKTIVEQVLGMGDEPAYGILPPIEDYQQAKFYFADMPLKERVQRAKLLLKAAGYENGHPLTVQIRFNSKKNHKTIAKTIAEMWNAIGVQSTLMESEVDVLYKDLGKKNFEIARIGWVAGSTDPQNLLNNLLYKSKFNHGGYRSQRYENVLTAAFRNSVREQHMQLLHNAEQIALDDFALIPIYFFSTRNLVSQNIQGWVANKRDIHPTRWMSKNNLPKRYQ